MVTIVELTSAQLGTMGEVMRHARFEMSAPSLHHLGIETDERNQQQAHLQDHVVDAMNPHLLAHPGRCSSPRPGRGHLVTRFRIPTMGG